MNRLYFLSGLPRTGTTLLTCILNQNPEIHATSTSSLLDFLSGVEYVYGEVQQRHKNSSEEQLKNIFKSIISSYYSHIKSPYVIDKWRGWMDNIPQIIEMIDDTPKIICTYRPVEEIITSFLVLLEKDKDNFIDLEIKKLGKEVNNYNRAIYLWENGVVGESYHCFKQSLKYKNSLYISYKNLVKNPEETCNKIYNYLGIDLYKHNFNDIQTYVNDNDTYWKIKDLHKIRNQLQLNSATPENYLDDNLINYFKKQNNIFNHVES